MRLTLLAAAALSTLLATPALAQDPPQTRQCGTVDEVHAMLTDKYHERIIGNGVAAAGQVLMNVYANPDGTSWSVVMIRARDGVACITAEGTDWQTRADPAPAVGEGS